MITAAAAIESGAVSITQRFHVPDSMQVDEYTIHDSHAHPVETMTLADIVAESSNIGMAKVGGLVGRTTLASYLNRFGFGRTTGLGFPGESDGIVPALSNWSDATLATISYGQGVSVTPLQMASVYATIANGGVWVQPRLVGGTVDDAGTFTPAPASPTKRVLQPQTASILAQMLAYVVEDGTGTSAPDPRLPGRGQDRHRAQAVPDRGVLLGPVRRVVHRVPAGREPAHRDRRHPRRAGHGLRRRRRRPALPAGRPVRDPAPGHPDGTPRRAATPRARTTMTSTDPRTGARVSSEAVTPAFPPVSFADLVATVPGATIRGDAAVPLTDVAFDSREVAPGALFFCVPGRHVDGHAFAPQARDAGAAALVVERWLDVDAPQALVPSVRRAMGPMSSSAFGDPAASMATVGVTGTNGKTTVTYILESIFRAAGRTAGVIGTTGASIDGRPVAVARTTPEAPDLHRLLARMRDGGVQAVALEVSSHALDQHRVDGVVFDVAIFTNLSQDHLDFHANMEAYFEAKARLFTPEHASRAVVNADDPSGRRLADGLVIDATTFGVDPGADVRAEDVAVTPEGIAFTVGGLEVRSRLRGAFNVGNVLAAVAAARALGIDDDPIRDGIGALGDVPGRMEPVEAGQDFLVVVDYAHTPDSIRSVLRASRPLTSGRLILVFGCGGDRDRAKRSPMGAAATGMRT